MHFILLAMNNKPKNIKIMMFTLLETWLQIATAYVLVSIFVFTRKKYGSRKDAPRKKPAKASN